MSLIRGRSASLLRTMATQRSLAFPGNAKIEFPVANTYAIHKAPKGGWPLKVQVVEGEPGTIALELEKKPANDYSDLSRPLRKATRGTVVQIDGEDVVAPFKETSDLLKRLNGASSFTVFAAPEKTPRRQGNIKEATKFWGKTNPIIGHVTIIGSTPAELKERYVFFTLHKTPQLAASLVRSARGRVIVTNLHPMDVVRIRRIAGGNVTGIEICQTQAKTMDKLFPDGKARRNFVGKLVSRVQGESLSNTIGLMKIETVASAALTSKVSARKAAKTVGHQIDVVKTASVSTTKAASKNKAVAAAPKPPATVLKTKTKSSTPAAVKSKAPAALKSKAPAAVKVKKPVANVVAPVADDTLTAAAAEEVEGFAL
jgi:hypothetical protein